jgi:hypothetical protein
MVPGLETLDDRLTPSAFAPQAATTTTTTTTDAATHFLVVTRESTDVGEASPITVIALDAANHVVRNYMGTVAITSSDPDATLPAHYTFTAADRGVHVFTETFATAGTETVTATDTSDRSLTGTASLTVDAVPAATHFAIVVEPHVYAGEQTQVVVVALDAGNHIVKDFSGSVDFTSSDSAATLPASYTFAATDHGVHSFPLTLATTGTQTLTVTDATTNSILGTISITVNPTQVSTHFEVLVRSSSAPGAQTQVMVVALDTSNQVVLNYTGTIAFTSSDSRATLPGEYTFTTEDRGIHVFSVTFTTAGSQTLTATDTDNSELTGSALIKIVSPASRHSNSSWEQWF